MSRLRRSSFRRKSSPAIASARSAKRFRTFEGLESRVVMTADLTPPELFGSVVGAETGRLDIGADLKLNFTEPIKPGSSGNIRLYRDSGALLETFPAATSTALQFVADTITINPTWDLDGSQGYYLSIDANSILDLSDNPFAGVSDTTTLRFLTDVETRGALGSSPIRDEFPGTSQEQIGDHRAIYIRVTFPDVNRSPNALADAVADMNLTSPKPSELFFPFFDRYTKTAGIFGLFRCFMPV